MSSIVAIAAGAIGLAVVLKTICLAASARLKPLPIRRLSQQPMRLRHFS